MFRYTDSRFGYLTLGSLHAVKVWTEYFGGYTNTDERQVRSNHPNTAVRISGTFGVIEVTYLV